MSFRRDWNQLHASVATLGVSLLCTSLLPARQVAAAPPPEPGPKRAPAIRGEPITKPPATAAPAAPAPARTNLAILERADQKSGDYILLGFDKLSAFDYDVYEVYSETNAGRPLLRSDHVIPPQIKAYHGRKVIVTGFILPMRTRNRQVTEFLLLRDQGTCCFGQAARMNHFIRVKMRKGGFQPVSVVPYRVSGSLRVGENYVGQYLTGIYAMDADQVEEDDPIRPGR